MAYIYNKTKEKLKRAILRNNSTQAEKELWLLLKNEKLGYKFRRQYSVDNLVLDFYCPELKLCIELDGEYHLDKEVKEYDKVREKFLENLGIKILRFKNSEVFKDPIKVREAIVSFIQVKIKANN